MKLKESCVKHLFPNGTARPYLKVLFKLLEKLKQHRKIDKVVMYTSAPNISNNQSGYIYFLKDCLETYCNTPNLYDVVLHRNNVKAHITKEGATIKDFANLILPPKLRNKYFQLKFLNSNQKNINNKITQYQLTEYINYMTKNITMIDDKTQNIINHNGTKIGVSKYLDIPHLKDIYSCIDEVPNFKAKLINLGVYHELCHNFFKEYRNEYNPLSITNKPKKDDELLQISYRLFKQYG